MEILSDMYGVNRELTVETGEACFDQILTRNAGKCKISEKIQLPGGQRVLQICHSSGLVKLDQAEAGEDMLSLDGVLEVKLLYLTDDDSCPIQSVTELLPFHYDAEAPGNYKGQCLVSGTGGGAADGCNGRRGHRGN